jgi:hypothetical protein
MDDHHPRRRRGHPLDRLQLKQDRQPLLLCRLRHNLRWQGKLLGLERVFLRHRSLRSLPACMTREPNSPRPLVTAADATSCTAGSSRISPNNRFQEMSALRSRAPWLKPESIEGKRRIEPEKFIDWHRRRYPRDAMAVPHAAW